MSGFWTACLSQFEQELPPQQFNTWILPLQLEGEDDYANGLRLIAPNGFILVDMVGNVWEWISDWYDPEVYQGRSSREPTEDPEVYVDKMHKRVVRGASWASIPVETRVSNRGFFTPADGVRDFGFRCLVDDIPEAPSSP